MLLMLLLLLLYSYLASAIPGILVKSCGKKYFLGNNELTSEEAHQLCCKLDMQPASFETAQELFCLSRYMRGNMKLPRGGYKYWTSAKKDSSKSLVWCNDYVDPVVRGIWSNVATPSRSNKVAIILGITEYYKTGLVDAKDEEKQRALCEVEDDSVPSLDPPVKQETQGCSKPICPNIECQADTPPKNKKEDSDIAIKLTNFTALGGTCNSKKYYVSNYVLNFAGAYAECCALNLRPVTFNTRKELECVGNLLAPLKGHKLMLTSMGDFIVWLSGTSLGCKDKWTWCTTGNKIEINNKMWPAARPDNAHDIEYCLGMSQFFMQKGLEDVECDEHLPFLCESD